jgi:NAD(P)-dependent dehydrogenase (short-subunit alcohol dehydrogenase family)
VFDLTGKRALVTGGSAGIGLGMARGFAKAGADVALWGRSPERLRDAAADLAEHGGRILDLLTPALLPEWPIHSV